MRKLYYLLIIALAAFSCTKEEMGLSPSSPMPDAPQVGQNVFTATIEGPQTRAYVSGSDALWNEHDLVAVFPGYTSAHRFMVSEGSEGQSSTQLVEQPYNTVDYNGDGIFNDEAIPSDATAIGANLALYPYSGSYSGSSFPPVSPLNTCEDLGDGKYRLNFNCNGSFSMVAVTNGLDDRNFTFKQLCGLLKFSLIAPDDNPIGLDSMTIISNDGEIISGPALVTVSYDSEPEIQMQGGRSQLSWDSYDIDRAACDDDGIIWLDPSTPTEFYVAVPPVTFDDGITVVFNTTTGIIVRNISQKLVVERAHIKPLATLPLATNNTTIFYESTDDDIVTPARLTAIDKDGVVLQCENVYGDFFGENIGQLKFNGVVDAIDLSFAGCTNLAGFAASCTNIIKLTTAEDMFANCSNLKYADLSLFDFSQVTSMSAMFSYATSLRNVWFAEDGYGAELNTSNVTNLSFMFNSCESLQTLDLSGFDTSEVTDMRAMFQDCNNLTNLDISSFDTSKVTDMAFMFNCCTYLPELDVSSFTTSEVTTMRAMFQGCNSLLSLNVDNFDTSNVTDMSAMFWGMCYLYNPDASHTLDLSSFDTSNVLDMSYMFTNSTYLESVDVSSFDTSNVTSMEVMFYGAQSLRSLDLSSFDTSNVTSMEAMFAGAQSLLSLDLGNFVTSNVENMTSMFYQCTNMEELNVSSFNTSNVTTMDYMFGWMRKIQSIDVSNFDTRKVTDMSGMFDYCGEITSLDLSNFVTSNVTKFDYMFEDCAKLESINISSFDTSNATNVEKMFALTPSLNSIKVGENTNGCAFDSTMFDQIGLNGVLKYPQSCDYSQWLSSLAVYGWSGETYTMQ